MHKANLHSDSKAFRLTLISLSLSTVICLIKFLAYYLTGSVAIYSDAMESIVNIFSALLAMIGTKIALKPSDKEHPYGHTKVEYLVSIVESFFILLASISIFWEAWQSIIHKKMPENLNYGLFFLSLGLILNLLLALPIYRQGKREASPILISHATHLFTDVLTTLGVFAGILITKITELWFIDALLGMLISINILYLGYKIFKDSINSLLDVSLSKEKIEDIFKIINESIKTSSILNIQIGNFKSRKAGRKNFIEFNLIVPGETSVQEAHDLCDHIEKNIKETHPDINVIIHIEPIKSSQNNY